MKSQLGRDTVADRAAFARRVIRATGKAASRGDAEDLAVVADLHREVDEAMRTAVAGLRQDGWTWESIGRALGVTRQAALMRWGEPASATEA